jgi:hypothetical protein
MFLLPHIKARVERLRELTVNLGKEVVAQRDAEGLLLPLERRQYLAHSKAAWRSWTRPASSWRA